MRNFNLRTALLAVFLLVGSLSFVATAQERQITGVVSDAHGPMAGVSVIVDGTSVGTATDTRGQYMINAPAGAALRFSFLGYEDQIQKVGAGTVIDVVMKEAAQEMEELVVIGYGVQRKSDITGSVASIKASDLNVFPASNIGEMLRGKAAGINVTSTSGRPGAAPEILIRGKRSLTGGNDPLIIVDGTPVDNEGFAALNSADIQSVEVLKDAAAQAIYGARAANGVILVTTKRGEKGGYQVNLDGYVGVQYLQRNFDFYSADEFYELRKQALRTEWNRMPVDAHEVLQDAVMEKNYADRKFTDWEDLMLSPALMQKYDVSVRGGTEKLRLAASLGYYDQDGMVEKSGFRRGNLRLNVDYDMNRWLSMGFNASYSRSKTLIEDGNFNEYISRTPLGSPYNEDGSYREYINDSQDHNPLYKAENADHHLSTDNYKINGFVDVRLFKGFTYRLNASLTSDSSEEGQYKKKGYTGGGQSGSLINGKNELYLIENIFNYAVPIRNENHRLNLTFVQSYDYERSRAMGYSAVDVPVDYDWNMLPAGKVSGISRKYTDRTLLSFMARAQYNLMDKYLFTVSWRRDGSSVFGSQNKWGNFPSAAFAWRINNESFLKDVEWLTNLKLRLSYGQVGNQAIPPYRTLGATESRDYLFGDNYTLGYIGTTELANQTLKWETTASTNVGVDFGFFNNRLSGTVEYYNTTTTDLLVNRTMAGALGYTSVYDNLGKTRTRGVDINISGDIIRKEGLRWNVGVNFSHSRNEILKINGKTDPVTGKPINDEENLWFIGKPIDVYYDYVFDGIYQYSDFEPEAADFTGTYTPKKTFDSDGDGVADQAIVRSDTYQPGHVKVKDLNNDGKIDANDRKVIRRDPDFVASLSTLLYWKGFDLFVDFYAVSGVTRANKALTTAYGGTLQGKLNGVKVNYWTPENPSNEYPRPIFNSNTLYFGSISYKDASYLRMRTLSLGYTLPAKLSRKISMERLRFYVTGTNLFTSTKFLAYSPEVTTGAYPEASQVIFGVNITF